MALFADAAPCRREVAVAPRLHQLEIVVAEPPEEGLGLVEHARVVVVLELLGRLANERGEVRQHAAVERLGDRPARLGLHQREPRRIQQLDRQPAADLHLLRVERRVGAGRPLAAQ